MDMPQLMQLLLSKVYLCKFNSLLGNKFYHLIGNGCFFFLTEVASQLGYDDLDAVTTEDMTLEVKWLYNTSFSDPTPILLGY